MFTQNCFIRLSTPKLTDGLRKLGGRNGTGFWHSNVQTLLIAESDKYYCLKDECGNVDYLIKNGYIDCQINEDLFLSLSALRNDSDIYQWFICKQDYLSCHNLTPINKGVWQLNTKYDKLTYSLRRLWKKATVKEILNSRVYTWRI